MQTEQDIRDLLDRMAQAYSAGDAAGCAALFSQNARLHSPFALPAVGRSAIEQLHREWTRDASAKKFSIIEFGGSDVLAWCLTQFTEADGSGDGTSLIVLERSPGDRWLIRSCCLFGDPE